MGTSIVDTGIDKKLIKDKISEIHILSRSKKSVNKKYKHIKINYITENIINLKKIPQVDYIIYCLRNNNIKISNIYFNKFLRLLETIKRKPKILFASSGAVYGKNTNKIKDKENKKINLTSINKLIGYKKKYAKEKIFIENKFIELGQKNYDVSIARCYTFVGKHILNQKYAISDIINNLYLKKNIKLNARNQVYRSYMYSDDLVEWLIKIVKNSNKRCPIYNVGSDKEINLRKLIKIVAKKFNNKYKLNKVISNKIDYYVPKITKAKKELNLNIKFDLMKAINLTLKTKSE